LKKAGARLILTDNLQRRKMGLGAPVGDWMRRELRPMLEDARPGAPLFSAHALRDLVRAHVEGQNDHTDQLWSLLWLGLWHSEMGM
jgi:asparagine synthase (glutamine-hydrolysing)